MSRSKPTYTWVTTRQMEREKAEGRPIEPKPSNIRVYDNGGETADRFTIVNTKSFVYRGVRYYPFATSSEDPFHPRGSE